MKKITALAVVICVLLTSCNAGADPSQVSSTVNAEPVYIGTSFGDLDDNYLSVVKSELENIDSADSLLTIEYSDAAGSADTQLSQIQTMLSNDIDVLMVNLLDVNDAAIICDLALTNELSVVFFGDAPPIELLDGYDNYSYVGVEQSAIGQLQAEMALDDLTDAKITDKNNDGALQYILVKGQEGNPLTSERSEAVIATLNDNGATLVAEAYCDWSSELAQKQMESWLLDAEISGADAVLCNSDSMAIGAVQAINAADLDMAVYGIDSIPQAVELIANGDMTGTIYDDPYKMAKSVCEIAADIARGNSVTENSENRISAEGYILVAPVVVNK